MLKQNKDSICPGNAFIKKKRRTKPQSNLKYLLVHHDVNIACVLSKVQHLIISLAYSEEIQSLYQLIMVGSTKPCRF